jgi:hypothetical protein
MLMHASLTGSTLILGPALSGVALLTHVLVWAAALWVMAAAVIAVGWRSRNQLFAGGIAARAPKGGAEAEAIGAPQGRQVGTVR